MTALSVDWTSYLWFFAAVLLLDALEITLPRGDSILVSGSVVAAVAIIRGPAAAVIIGVVSILTVQVARRGVVGLTESISRALLRGAAVLLATSASRFIPVAPGPGIHWSRILLLPAVALIGEMVGQQLLSAYRTHRPLRPLLAGNIRRQALLVAAEVCVAGLAAVLYDSVGLWALVPVVTLMVLIRQAYAMLLEIRETYHQTLQVLVDAAESTEAGRTGHSERVANIAREIGAGCGLSTADIERVSYAALLHDVHGISDYPHSHDGLQGTATSVVKEVGFFAEVVPVLRVVEGDESDEAIPTEKEMLAGYIVALASDIDAAIHPEVAEAHDSSGVARVRSDVPSAIKARAVASAVERGYPVPAID